MIGLPVQVRTFDGHLWQAPALTGHVEGEITFNRTPQQTRGSGRTFVSGAGTRKPVVMQVEIPLTPLPAGQVTWDTGGMDPPDLLRRSEHWEEILESADRWYVGPWYRQVEGLQLLDKSVRGKLTAQLILRDPLWRLTPDDPNPRRNPVTPGEPGAPTGELWSLTVQPLERAADGSFVRGAVVVTGVTRVRDDAQSGNATWRFGAPILLSPLAGLLASHAEQSRTRGGTAHVVADPGVGLCAVTYQLAAPSGAPLAGTTTGVLTLESVLATTTQVTQTLTVLRCERLHLRDGTLVTP